MAVVRPEFRVEVLVPEVGDAIFSAPGCVVAGCDRAGLHKTTGLCRGHHRRWQLQGRPELAGFVAATAPRTCGRAQLESCVVPGCRYGRARGGLCNRHARCWRRAGQPNVAGWIATMAGEEGTAAVRPGCRLPWCELWAETEWQPLCRSHMSRWGHWRRRTGSGDLEEFLGACAAHGLDRFDLRGLPAQLTLELQYALQCRADERRARLRPHDASVVLRLVARSGATSLLDWPQAVWDAEFTAFTPAAAVGSYAVARGFLRYSRQRVDDLACGQGWEAEYPRDVWDLRRLGLPGQPKPRRLRFDRIGQPWLRELAKRWLRWQLGTGISASHAARQVLDLTAFAAFLAGPTVEVTALAGLSRGVLERYAASVAAVDCSARRRAGYLGTVHAFLLAIRQHRWDPALPADATFYPEDFPKRPALAPRHLPEFVMAQIEQPANLARFADPTARLATLILIRTGLRVGDATRLAFDCLVHDGHGAPYLRYWNHKLAREAIVPLDDELADEIRAQQQRVLSRWAEPAVLLPRHHANPDGRWPLPVSTYHRQLAQWLAACDIRDEHRRPVRLTPHQWRHTFATRLLNLDVPQEVVRRLLDHESHQMTAHYARLHDQTVRRHWEQARKVNIAGEAVTIQPDSPLAEVQWTKHRVGLATQALPNGYCGLPVQQTCPHANACLTCPVFITTPEFLDQHREHREQTRRLLATAKGQLRLAEMNQQVLGNLDRIIAALEADKEPPPAERGEVADAG